MPFCPTCKSEFSDNSNNSNSKICDECGVELVENLSLVCPTAEAEEVDLPLELELELELESDNVGNVGNFFYVDWQAIYPVPDDVFGSAVEALLKSAGIAVKLDRLHGGDIFWRLEVGTQGFDKYVFVPKPDVQRGYELIKEYLEGLET